MPRGGEVLTPFTASVAWIVSGGTRTHDLIWDSFWTQTGETVCHKTTFNLILVRVIYGKTLKQGT